jgi:hypothetical protein
VFAFVAAMITGMLVYERAFGERSDRGAAPTTADDDTGQDRREAPRPSHGA